MNLASCRRVVAGSDLSKGSDAAVRLAVAWAARCGADVVSLHAAPGLPPSSHADIAQALRTQARESAAEEMAVDVDLLVADAGDIDAIVTGVAACDGTWACVGCEGSAATILRQSGHVTRRLAESTAAPLLLAPLGWKAPPRRRYRAPAGAGLPARRRAPTPFHRMLVALSGGPRDGALLDAAVELARHADGGLALAHVVDLSASRHQPPPVRATLREETEARVATARERLLDLSNDAVPLEMAARHEVLVHVVAQGPVERDLAGLARSQSIELLVVGTGPVAARLASFAPCPVLVLP